MDILCKGVVSFILGYIGFELAGWWALLVTVPLAILIGLM